MTSKERIRVALAHKDTDRLWCNSRNSSKSMKQQNSLESKEVKEMVQMVSQ